MHSEMGLLQILENILYLMFIFATNSIIPIRKLGWEWKRGRKKIKRKEICRKIKSLNKSYIKSEKDGYTVYTIHKGQKEFFMPEKRHTIKTFFIKFFYLG